jgi:putative ABC transport system permease protein
MLSPRWQKLWRDLWLTRGRITIMVIAMAVSIIGIGTVLSAYSILIREISRNYLGTNPASATLELDRVDDALADAVKERPGIADAQVRATILARVQVGPDIWRPLVLFVVPDFDALRINIFRSEAGAWPPPDGTMLVERTALPILNARVGDTLLVKTPHGAQRAVPISGMVHDPGLAPAWQESEGYAYLTPATLALLGESGMLDELRIVVSQRPFDAPSIEQTARDLAGWLQQQGRIVKEIRIPSPGRHPHQGQMNAVMSMMLSFSVMALVLGAVLVATIVAGLLAQQIRQIGAMKTIGARSRQIATMYLVLIALISGAAVALGAPLGVVAARAFARTLADALNFTLYSEAIPWWVFAAQVAAGLLVPLVVALGPIARASRITVYEAISDFGVSQRATVDRGLVARLSALRGLDRSVLLALRNTLRRRARLLFTLGLLASGGALFMTGLNVATGWQSTVDNNLAARRYDLEVQLSRPEPAAPLISRLRGVSGVQDVEAWGEASTALDQPSTIDVVHTYPDGRHASFTLRAPPAATTLIQFPVLAGRWLQPGDTDAVVLTQMVRAQLPDVAVGDTIALSIDGRPTTWRVVGIVQEIGQPAAYVTDTAFARATGQPGYARNLRIVTATRDPAARAEIIQSIERALVEAGVDVDISYPEADLRAAIDGHSILLIIALIFMAVLMAVVGLLGLSSTMSTNVLERTREFGVLQTIGATPRTVLRIVLSEGVVIGALSWFVAFALSLPLSTLVGGVAGNLMFRAAQPFVISPPGVLIWLAIVLGGSAVASAVPAWRASRLTIRETLAYI